MVGGPEAMRSYSEEYSTPVKIMLQDREESMRKAAKTMMLVRIGRRARGAGRSSARESVASIARNPA